MTRKIHRPGLTVTLEECGADAEGSCRLRLDYRPTGAAARLLCGRPVATVPELVRSLFTLCSDAQQLAARQALAAAAGGTLAAQEEAGLLHAVRMEALRESSLHILVGWSQLCGVSPLSWAAGEILRATRIERGGETGDIRTATRIVGETVFGRMPLEWLSEGWSDSAAIFRWAFAGETLAARVLRRAIADDFVPAHPSPGGDTPLGRNGDDPMLRDFERGSLAAHLAARLVELAALCAEEGMVPPAFRACGVIRSEPGVGEAQVACSRGTLVHRAWVEDGVVAHYEIESPTDAAFGEAARGKAWLEAVARMARPRRLDTMDRVLLALDPCVEYAVEEAYVASDEGRLGTG